MKNNTEDYWWNIEDCYHSIKIEYKKNFLDNTANESSKFIIQNYFEINEDLRETYCTNRQITIRISMLLKSSFRDYSDAYIPVKGDVTIIGAWATNARRTTNRNNKQVISKP